MPLQKTGLKKYNLASIENKSFPSGAENFSYFADCLSYNISFSGEFSTIPFGNHLTQIDSLIFILEFRLNSTNNYEYRCTWHHIRFLIKKDKLLKRTDPLIRDHHKDIPYKLNKLLSTPGDPKNSIKKGIPILKEIRSQLENNYLRHIVNYINSTFHCTDHLPKEHMEDLDYLSRMIYGYFFRKGYSKMEIQWFVNEILSKEVRYIQNKKFIYSKGPLPPYLYERLKTYNDSKTTSKDPMVLKDIESYFCNRQLHEQVSGILHLSNYIKAEYKFLFRIDNLLMSDGYFDFEGVRIYSHKHFIRHWGNKVKKMDESSCFFNRKNHKYNFSFASITVKSHSFNWGVLKAVQELQEKVRLLSLHQKEHMQLNTLSYIAYFEEDFKEEMFNENSVPDMARIVSFQYGNHSELSERYKSSIFPEYFRKIDIVLSQAYSELDPCNSISIYWKMCDIITNAISKNEAKKILSNPHEISKDVRIMSMISSYYEKNNLQYYGRQWGYNVLINNTEKAVKGEEKQNYEDNKFEFFPGLSRLLKDSKHPHVNYWIKKSINNSRKSKFKTIYNHYLIFFLHVWYLRNSNEHYHHRNKELARQMKQYTHEIIWSIRINLFIELRDNNKFDSPKELILHILKECEARIN